MGSRGNKADDRTSDGSQNATMMSGIQKAIIRKYQILARDVARHKAVINTAEMKVMQACVAMTPGGKSERGIMSSPYQC